MKAQASLDLLLIVGLGLLIVFAFYSYAFRISEDEIATKKAEISLRLLRNSVLEVYSLNPGSSEVVELNLPKNVLNYTYGNRDLCYVLSLSSGVDEVCASLPVNLTHVSLPTQEGTHYVTVMYVGGDNVEIQG